MSKNVEVIRKFPDAILKEKAKTIENIDGVVIETLDKMLKVVRLAEGAGLAANQIGIGRQLAIAMVEEKRFVKLINPRIKELDGEEVDEEGCLSIPGAIIKVPRAKRIVIEYLNEDGNTKILEAKGFAARVLQHEIDHLNGILIIDKLKPEEKLKFLREYKRIDSSQGGL